MCVFSYGLYIVPFFILWFRRIICLLHNFAQLLILLNFEIEKMGKKFCLSQQVSVSL